MTPSIAGRTLPDGFTLVQRLGKGGFGEVWQGTSPGGVPVALKFLPLASKGSEIELKALEAIKTLRHAYLLTLLGVWQLDTEIMLAMELAECTLLAYAERSPGAVAPRAALLEYLRQAADALDFLRGKSITHGDVKPQNLLLVPGGILKVADFGLARVLEHSITTASGRMTPAYAAPEMFDNKASDWSDQYSLAVTYCRLRGGKLPRPGSALEIAASHLSGKLDLSMLPDEEWPVVLRALAYEPRERWTSCRHFIDELQAVRPVTTPPTVVPQPGRDSTVSPPPPLPTRLVPKHSAPTQAPPGRPTWSPPPAPPTVTPAPAPPRTVGPSTPTFAGAPRKPIPFHPPASKLDLVVTVIVSSGVLLFVWLVVRPDDGWSLFAAILGTILFVLGYPVLRLGKWLDVNGRPKPESELSAELELSKRGALLMTGPKNRHGEFVLGVTFDQDVSPDGLTILSHLSRLEYLCLNYRSLDDVGVFQLHTLNKLDCLLLQGSVHVTDAGLQHLAGLGSIRALTLSLPNITDAGLAHLRLVKGLQQLTLQCPKVTAAGVAGLRKERPGIDVDTV